MLSRRPYPLTVALPLKSDKFNLCSCAIRFFHLLHTVTQTECSCTPCPKKYTPWLLTVRCCNLSAIMLINPLNTVRLSLRSHQRSSALSSLSDSAAESEFRLFLPVIVPSTPPQKLHYSTTVPFPLTFPVGLLV